MAGVKENLFAFKPINFKDKKRKSNSEKKDDSAFMDKYDPLTLCRTCANMDPCLVPIFKEEGSDYSLDKKIEKYLPIEVSPEDDLPVHLCYHCASVLISWDALFVGCAEAERKLNLLKNTLENKQCDEIVQDVDELLNENIDSDDEPLISKKLATKTKKNDEKRDILQEKNNLQTSLVPIGPESERLMEEPDISFSTYQHQFTMRRPFLYDILKLRIDNAVCCGICETIDNFKFAFKNSLTNSKSHSKSFKAPNVEFENRDKKSKKRKRLKSKDGVACENCGKVLSGKLSLANHIKTHCNEKTLTCHICGKTFRHRFNLLRHLRVIHEGLRNHVCVDCGKRYRSHGEMEDHRNVHSVQQKIVCEECGKIFLTKASFYPHKKSHRLQKCKKAVAEFDCEECHKKFTTKKSRNQHMSIHTGEKPIACDVCGKNFRTKANFKQHAKVHSDEKPFGCEHCGKAFARKDHLRIHVRCHTGEKPFVCNFCGRGFAQMNDMKKHLKIHDK